MDMGQSVANLRVPAARMLVTSDAAEATRENPIATQSGGTPEFQNRTSVLFLEEKR
jgi:hypothetical protein